MSGVYKKIHDSDIILRIADNAWIPNDPLNRDRVEFEAWLEFAGNLPDPADPVPEPEVPEMGTLPPVLIASALNIVVAENDIQSVGGIFGLAGAVYIDTGMYMLFFMASQPNTDYYAILNGGAPCMAVIEKNEDYMMIQSSNTVDGPTVDALPFSVQIYRVT